MIIYIAIIVTVILLFEYQMLKKQNRYREILFSAGLLVIGIILSGLVYYKVNIPSPLLIIIYIYNPVSSFITNLLT